MVSHALKDKKYCKKRNYTNHFFSFTLLRYTDHSTSVYTYGNVETSCCLDESGPGLSRG